MGCAGGILRRARPRLLDLKAWQHLQILCPLGKCRGSQAKLELTGHLQLEPSISKG